MPPRFTYPGVYVEERSSGVRAIAGVSTSTTLFVGMARKGPIGVPRAVRSVDQYIGIYGDDVNYGEMTAQVRQAFLNGVTEAVVVRGANGHFPAQVTLRMESSSNVAGAQVLRLEARDSGDLGNLIRAVVDYDTPQPELTFNIELFRRSIDVNGAHVISDNEFFGALSMDPEHPRFVETILNAQSALVTATSLAAGPQAGGYSQSAAVIAGDAAALQAAINTALGDGNMITVAVDGGLPVAVTLPPANGDFVVWAGNLQNNIAAALASAGQPGAVTATAEAFGAGQVALRLTSTTGPSVVITSGRSNDATGPLQLGAAAGGIEVGGWSRFRPAPSAFVTAIHQSTSTALGNNTNLSRLIEFANADRATVATWTLTGTMPTVPAAGLPTPFAGAVGTFLDGPVAGLSLRNTALHLDSLAAALGAVLTEWTVRRVGYRLSLAPKFGDSNAGLDAALSTGATDIGTGATGIATPAVAQNTAAYSLGTSGTTVRQIGGADGDNGVAPTLDDYMGYFSTVERNFFVNLVTLPRGDAQDDDARLLLWGPASAFWRDRRAFLIVDPPSDDGAWGDVDQARAGIQDYRLGTVTDHAAIYWPRIVVGFRPTPIDPSGTIAGVMARTDTRRGVWKAPAGLEARTLGARGFEHLVTDGENGVTNPEAINTLRQFAAGGVVWGARTMAGFENSGETDYAYVPVRRTALFIEESLYRGLKFAVFEPNDYRLWSQIRLAAGGFMQNLFRQGAFQGAKASDAYQVICDETTTTQHDINLGRVNVLVLFAPLRPAEFVYLVIQQLAGQQQT
jgi:uncharacterized protein